MVLFAALLMPVLMPWAANWKWFTSTGLVVTADPQTLLQELQARIQSKTAPAPVRKPVHEGAPSHRPRFDQLPQYRSYAPGSTTAVTDSVLLVYRDLR